MRSFVIPNSAKYPLFVLIFLFSFIAFLPKENIYFYTLEKLHTKNISVQNEEFSSGFFDFSVANSDVFYKNINAFKIENMELQYLLVYGKIEFFNIVFDGLKVENIKCSWSIFNPLQLDILLTSDELSGYGTYDIQKKNFELYLKPSQNVVKKYEVFWSFGELTKDGEYKIEYNL